MLAAPLDLEATARQSLASRYRAEGYEVVVDPRGPELPEALRQFSPDLLARRGDELVVAEVRRRRPGGGRWREVERLAEVTRTLPGARFDLVVLDDAEDGPEAASRDWSADEIQRALADVEKLVEEKRTAPAILLLYAALEPEFRAIAARESVFVPGFGINRLISALTSEGVISRRDYRTLMDGLDARNAIAHGLRPDTVLDGAALRRLLATARRLARGSKAMQPQREPAA
jgi:hypothetical protein